MTFLNPPPDKWLRIIERSRKSFIQYSMIDRAINRGKTAPEKKSENHNER